MSVVLGVIVWSTIEQQWLVSVASLNVLALIALLLARGSRGDHLPPSLWLIGGMAVVLVLPLIAVCLHDMYCVTGFAAAISSIVAFCAMRAEEVTSRRRLATGDFHDVDLW
ncbi:MAG: hypothetical protein Q4D79_10155 [Propionibacteriaceae bacterium]|nr:hypothetical protein [Propionibacteriaceae bacterium]